MLFCLCLVALLLYDTVFASAVCSQTFDKAPGKIEAVSTHYHHLGRRKCVYLIRAPLDFSISLNFTDIFGFIPIATAATSTETSSDNGTNLGSAGILSTSSAVASAVAASKDRYHHQTRYRHPHSAFETNRSSSEAESLSSQPVPTVTLITGPIRRGQCRLPQVEIVEENEVSGDKVVMGKICRSSHGNQLLLLVSGDEKHKNASVTLNTTSVNAMSASSAMTSTTPPQKVFHSVAHTLRLVYEWGLNPHLSGFSLEFNFQHKPTFGINKSGPCEFTCADSRCLSSWSMVCDGAEDCVDRSDEHDCPYHNSRLPTAQGTSKFGPAGVSSFQIIIIVIAVVLTVAVIAFMVSHYKMGARSWSDRWTRTSSQQVPQTGQSHHHHHQQQQHHHQHHSHPSPQHHHHHNNHLDHNTSTTTAYVQSPDERLSHEVALLRDRQVRLQSVQTDLELALPPSISLPDGEEYPYDSLQHLHLRNTDQENEILRECIRPPPNRTIFESESPPPYRACSMGTLHSSSSSTFSLMSASTNNGALRVRSADYSSPLVMRCHSMSSNNCNCGHHHASGGVGGGGSGRNATPVPQHLRIARLVNSRLSTAVSSTSLPASITSTSSSSSFCSFCDPPTAAASSTFPVNHNGHRCPNGTICTNSSGCCVCCPSKSETQQQRSVTSSLSGSSGGNSVVGARSGGSSSSSSSHEISQVPGASVANARVTDSVNGVRHHPVTLSLTVNSRDVVADDRNHSCSGGAFGDGNVEPGGDCTDTQWNGGGLQTKIL